MKDNTARPVVGQAHVNAFPKLLQSEDVKAADVIRGSKAAVVVSAGWTLPEPTMVVMRLVDAADASKTHATKPDGASSAKEVHILGKPAAKWEFKHVVTGFVVAACRGVKEAK